MEKYNPSRRSTTDAMNNILKNISELQNQILDYVSVYQLTKLQEELGYVQGEISTVAMLGLVGEAGEVLAETFTESNNSEFHSLMIDTLSGCRNAELYKKAIRKGDVKIYLKITDNHEELFDKELSDCFYYLNILATNRGLTIFDLAQMAHDKVRAKQAAGGSSEDPK